MIDDDLDNAINDILAGTPAPPDTEDEKLRKLVERYTKPSPAMKPTAQSPMSSTNEAYEKLKQAMMNSVNHTNPVGLGNSTAGASGQFVGTYAQSSSISISTPNQIGITSSLMPYNTAIGAPYQATPKSKKVQPTNEPEWRLVLGMILDGDTNNQKYITKSYFCVSKKEAKSYFKDDHEGKKFTAIFVLEDE
jgi:hypothetical protein